MAHDFGRKESIEQLTLAVGKASAKIATDYALKFAKGSGMPEAFALRMCAVLAANGVKVDDLDKYMAAAGDVAAAATSGRLKMFARATDVLGTAKRRGYLYFRDIAQMGLGVDDLRLLPRYARKTDDQLQELMTGGETIDVDRVFDLIAAAGPEKNNLGDVLMKSAPLAD